MTEQNVNSPQQPPPEPLPINYMKSHDHRTITIDGVMGGITQRNMAQLNLYIGRKVIPQQTSLKVLDTDANGQITFTEEFNNPIGKKGIVREIPVSVLLDKERLRSIAKWMEEKAEEIERNEKDQKPSHIKGQL